MNEENNLSAITQVVDEILIAALDDFHDAFTIIECIYDKNGKIIDFRHLYINKSGAKHLQLSPDEILHKLSSEVFPDLLKGSLFQTLCKTININQQIISDEKFHEEFYEIKSAVINGKLCVSWHANPQINKLTEELKNKNEELEEAKEFYRIMGETLPYGIWMCDKDGKAKYMSHSFLNLLEMTHAEAAEFGWSKRLRPESVEPMFQRWLNCVKTGQDWDSELEILGPDGKYHTILTRGKPVRDRDGNITSWVGINLDIDSRKEYENELARRARLIDTVADPIVGIDVNKNIHFWNHAAELLYGYTKDEVLGRSYREITRTEAGPEQDVIVVEQMKKQGFAEIEAVHYSKDGRKIFLDAKVILYTGSTNYTNGLLVVCRDVTNRKIAEQKILLQKRRAEQLSELSKELSRAEADYKAILDTIVKEVSSIIGDACVIRLLSDDGQYILPKAFYHPDQKALEAMIKVFKASPDKISEWFPHGTLLKGEPLLIPRIDQEFLLSVVKPEQKEFLKNYPIYSVINVPLIIQQKVIGTLGLGKIHPDDPYTTEDVHFLQTIADHASLAISNSSLYSNINKERELLKAIIDTVPAMIAIYDPSIQKVEINNAIEKITGWTKEDHERYGIMQLAYPEPGYRVQVLDYMQSLQPGFKDLKMTTKTGQVIETSWANIQIPDGRQVGIGIDVTERKTMEELLRINYERFELLAQTANELLKTRDLQQSIKGICSRIMKYVHCSLFINFVSDAGSQKLVLNAYDGIPEEAVDKLRLITYGTGVSGSVARKGIPYLAEHINNDTDPMLDPERALGIQAYICSPLHNERGQILGTLAFGKSSEDVFTSGELSLISAVTDQIALAVIRMQNEKLLSESEENFRLLADNISQFAWMADDKGWIFWYNKRWFEYTGTTPQEMEGWGWTKVHHPDHVDRVVNSFRECIINGEFWEDTFPLRSKDGVYSWFLSRALPVKQNGKIIRWFGTNTDITSQMQIEDELRSMNQLLKLERTKLEEIIENVPEGIVVCDPDGTTTLMNSQGLKLHGFETYEEMFTQLKNYESVFELCSLEGKRIPANEWPIYRSLRGELVRNFEVILRNNVKKQERIISYSSALVKEADQVAQIIFVMNDITEQKQTEQKLLATLRQLEISNKELEQFAFVASHDLQSPVRQISNFSQLLENKYKNIMGEDADNYLNFINTASKRMTQLIQGLLEFSGITQKPRQFSSVNCGEAVSAAMSNLDLVINETGAVIQFSDLPQVTGDPVLLIQLFQNLIQNGIKFCNHKTPHIKIWYELHGSEVVIAVSDNGLGIDKDHYDKVFIIFQRLHNDQSYSGTGIGLAICKRIVEYHGGRIWLDSEPGKGTTFYFTLPVPATE